jgi:Ligated ion channel L-glutamate- and glycine-binding site
MLSEQQVLNKLASYKKTLVCYMVSCEKNLLHYYFHYWTYCSIYLGILNCCVLYFKSLELLFYAAPTGVPQEFCCHGYAMDLLAKLSHNVNFTYSLRLVEDGSYGTYEKVSLKHAPHTSVVFTFTIERNRLGMCSHS